MKSKIFFSVLLAFLFSTGFGQSYINKIVYENLGIWESKISSNNIYKIEAYVTRQEISFRENEKNQRKLISDVPKYRYEIVLISNTLHNYQLTKTWIFNTRVFINGIEKTKEQFSEGFTVLINTNPTTVYFYETTDSRVNFKISWENSQYFSATR